MLMMGKYKTYTLKFKAAAIDFSKHHSISETARVFKTDRKRIREWINNEDDVKKQLQCGTADRKRLAGGGTKKR